MAQKNRKNGYLLLGGGLVFLLLGLGLLSYFSLSIWTGYQSTSWPTVQGKILTRELTTTSGSALESLPRIEYSYEVGGETYQSDRIRFGGFATDRNEGEEVLEKFASDDVLVYYSEVDPTQAVLEPGPRWGTHLAFVFGSFIFLVFSAVPLTFAYFEIR